MIASAINEAIRPYSMAVTPASDSIDSQFATFFEATFVSFGIASLRGYGRGCAQTCRSIQRPKSACMVCGRSIEPLKNYLSTEVRLYYCSSANVLLIENAYKTASLSGGGSDDTRRQNASAPQQLFCPLRRYRLAVVVALNFLDRRGRGEKRPLVLGLDALRHHLDIELARNADDRAHHGGAVGVFRSRTRQRRRNLQAVDVVGLQIIE